MRGANTTTNTTTILSVCALLYFFCYNFNYSVTHHCHAFTAVSSSSSSKSKRVVLTREKGKNDKLMKTLAKCKRLKNQNILLEEIPCIEHAEGPDADKLVPWLQRQKYSSFASDYIVITSPEAAQVFGTAYELTMRPYIGKVAAVGKATREALVRLGIEVDFVPSKATAATLVEELPEEMADGSPTRVLYPASLQAKETLQRGLEKRGFEVTRLNTYDTVSTTFSDGQVASAESASVACFGSPSAIKAFVENLGKDKARQILAACIGETSAEACRQMGWSEDMIFYPEKPGIEGWAECVADALLVSSKEVAEMKTL